MIGAVAAPVQDALEDQESMGFVPEEPGELTVDRMRGIFEDIREQPSWRNEADRAVDYYDGNQLDADTLAALQRKGMGPLITNVIAPIVNVVLGMEAKTRSDWRVVADSDQWQDFAEAMSRKLFEVERESRADRACSDGYAGQIKAGLGWVEVSRSSNPFEYPYRASNIHRREMFWDWRDQDPGLDKSAYQVRKRWYDVQQAKAYFPKFASLLDAAAGGDANRFLLERTKAGIDLFNSFEQERGFTVEDIEEWRSTARRRVAFYEVWHRHWVRGYVLRTKNNDVVELNTKNPIHSVLIARGLARPEPAVYSKLRMSLWVGPIKVHECACQENQTPYVPFWGYREDRTGVPYGLIRSMMSPQDEVNARRQKMMWLLGAKRVEMDDDALAQKYNDISTMLAEVGRPDAVVVLNSQRKNASAFKVDHNLGLSEQQFQIMVESKQAVQEVVGVFNAMLGRDAGANSGVAIDSLVEQGTTALAEINDNYRYARRQVGERLYRMMKQDMIGQRVDVVLDESGRKKTISLNAVVRDEETGQERIINDVRAAKAKVSLEDVPSTPSYRQQQLTMLAEVMKGLPPQLQAAIAPFYLEATSLQKRREMAQAARKALGMAEPQTPEEAQKLQQQQAEQAAMTRQAMLLDLSLREANVKKINAEADKTRAEIGASGNDDQAAQMQAQVQQIQDTARQEIDKLTADLVRTHTDAQTREARLQGEIAKLLAQLKSNAADRDAELRKAEIEKEIALIESEKEKEVARINAASEKVVSGLEEKMKSVRDELASKIEKVAATGAKEDKSGKSGKSKD